MRLNQFQEVIAIAERGSIRGAARHLQVGQPTLTRSLAELERELGVALFERRARGVVATPLGEAFVQRAMSILSDIKRASDELRQAGGAMTGTVTVGLSIAAHLALLPGALPPFIKRYPDVKLHIIEGFYPTLEASLRNGAMDFYIGVDPGQVLSSELKREVLSANWRTVLCRVGHKLAKATSLAELAGANWASTSITVADQDEVGTIFVRHGLPAPRLMLRSQSALTLMTCLLHSDLLAMVPVQWNDFALVKGMLATIAVREELAALPMVVIKRSDVVLTPAASYLLEALRRGRLLPVPARPTEAAKRPAMSGV